ncbi:MAG TPA: hypothetical protein VGQ71_00740 [Terriglobales bacterium]|jgi:hypothetical protein|nr:hypothetical protein [Terriglobales bacterium]
MAPIKAETEEATYRGGEPTAVERFLDRVLGNSIHLLLTLLAAMALAAAIIATAEIAIRDLPKLWFAPAEYQALHAFLQKTLLVAITRSLACCCCFTAPVPPSRWSCS